MVGAVQCVIEYPIYFIIIIIIIIICRFCEFCMSMKTKEGINSIEEVIRASRMSIKQANKIVHKKMCCDDSTIYS